MSRISTLNISETTRDRVILLYNVNEVIYALSNGDISNDLDGPLTQPGFQGHGFEVKCVLGTKFL